MPEGELLPGGVDTAAALRAMLAGLRGLLPSLGPVERLVISGDLTETGCARACEHLRDHDGPVQIAAGHVHRMITGRFAGRQLTIAPGTAHAVGLDLRPRAGIGVLPGHAGAVLHDVGSEARTLLISPQDFADAVRVG